MDPNQRGQESLSNVQDGSHVQYRPLEPYPQAHAAVTSQPGFPPHQCPSPADASLSAIPAYQPFHGQGHGFMVQGHVQGHGVQVLGQGQGQPVMGMSRLHELHGEVEPDCSSFNPQHIPSAGSPEVFRQRQGAHGNMGQMGMVVVPGRQPPRPSQSPLPHLTQASPGQQSMAYVEQVGSSQPHIQPGILHQQALAQGQQMVPSVQGYAQFPSFQQGVPMHQPVTMAQAMGLQQFSPAGPTLGNVSSQAQVMGMQQFSPAGPTLGNVSSQAQVMGMQQFSPAGQTLGVQQFIPAGQTVDVSSQGQAMGVQQFSPVGQTLDNISSQAQARGMQQFSPAGQTLGNIPSQAQSMGMQQFSPVGQTLGKVSSQAMVTEGGAGQNRLQGLVVSSGTGTKQRAVTMAPSYQPGWIKAQLQTVQRSPGLTLPLQPQPQQLTLHNVGVRPSYPPQSCCIHRANAVEARFRSLYPMGYPSATRESKCPSVPLNSANMQIRHKSVSMLPQGTRQCGRRSSRCVSSDATPMEVETSSSAARLAMLSFTVAGFLLRCKQ